jgi:hypothetical protein
MLDKKKYIYIKETSKKIFVIFPDSFDPEFDICEHKKEFNFRQSNVSFSNESNFFNLLIPFSLKISKNKINQKSNKKKSNFTFHIFHNLNKI